MFDNAARRVDERVNAVVVLAQFGKAGFAESRFAQLGRAGDSFIEAISQRPDAWYTGSV